MTIERFFEKWGAKLPVELIEDLKALLITEGHKAIESGFIKGVEFAERRSR